MFTIVDKGEGQNDIQSILFQEHFDILAAGINGLDCVLSGLACTAQGSPDMTVAVAKGAVLSNGIMYAVAAANATITAANGSNPRLDLIVITSAGAIAVRAGTAAAAPKPPARTANDVAIAMVYVPTSDTTISSDQITSMRVMRQGGPVCIYKTTTAETTDTTAAAIHLLNKANSGVTIPSGLFLAGKQIRVRLGGNILRNNTTTTGDTITVSYGGTTMYSDVAATAYVLDADRRAWFIDFTIVAQANNDQSISGHLQFQDLFTAQTAPATGIGDAWGGAGVPEGPAPFGGSAAVDSDAADMLLAVTYKFFTSNSANQIVVEFATVEIM